ncbi:MAG: recombination protein RecR [Deltaproteobacteria bacterium]|nr:recombination protein RecR [Deltaproteobacteria bacterium]
MEDPIQRLVRALKTLPGVGEKNAIRIAHHVMTGTREAGLELSGALADLVERARPCETCGVPSLGARCATCTDPRRDAGIVCVVEKFPDMLAIERSGEYRGLYHVLGGVLSPLDGVGPAELRLAALKARVKAGGVREVLIATNPTTEGEATAAYIADMLSASGVPLTRIASGIPMGGDIEYADRHTVARALRGRHAIKEREEQ